ncbi:MAG TPA: ABC transporter permease [Acidimicrobiia bacterium]
MARYVVLRTAWAIPVLLIVTFLTFWAVKEATDPAQSYLRSNPRATPEMVAAYEEAHGLVGSTPEQYVRWLGNFVTLDWGNSIKGNTPVWPDLKRAMANSLVLGIAATVVGIVVGLAIGVLSALRQYSKFDTLSTGAAYLGISMPPFVSAVLLQVFFAVTLTSLLELETPLLPVAGMYPPGQTEFDLWLRVKHMILPVTVVAIQIIAVYSQVMRASLLDVKESEYMRTARSKGISEKRVIIRHAIRNALIPIATLAALQFGAIVGGLIITERIFEYKGTGDYLITALGNGDFPQVMPLMFIVVASVILFNLLADISYAWLDPRIRLD